MPAAPSPLHTETYDEWFQDSSATLLRGLLPDDDWRWWKAQCYQESLFDTEAMSGKNAVGVCQLIPGAALDAGLHPAQRTKPKANIRAGAWILRRNINTWWPRPTRLQRLELGQASYNAGAGNIIKAQLRCGGGRLWEDIEPCLEQVTGSRNSHETRTYVRRIAHWYALLTTDQNGD